MFAFIARLDPTQSKLQVASISWNSLKCLPKLNKSPDFREIDATCSLLCEGFRRATIAEHLADSEKKISTLQTVFLTFLSIKDYGTTR